MNNRIIISSHIIIITCFICVAMVINAQDDEEDNTAIELHEEHGLLNSLELIDPAQQAEQKKPR